MTPKKLIGLVGEPACGKGSVTSLIIKHFGGTRVATSDILKRTLKDLNIESSRDNLINLALIIKQGFGDPILMKAMLHDIEAIESELVIVDGIRMPGDAEVFKSAYGDDFKLIYVTASQRTRYERSVKRGEKAGESEATFEEFVSKELNATEKDIALVGATADFRIDNDGSAEELEEKVKAIMAKI